MRILLVDDHPILRYGIARLITAHLPGTVVSEAGDATAALELVRTREWDVVVLDLTMPGASGFDVLMTIRRERPSVPVLVLSMHPPETVARRVMLAGASGYLPKNSAPTELVQALRRVAAGHKYLNEAVLAELRQDERAPHESLSDREYQVLRLLASGKSISEIAVTLGLSVKTISTYRSRTLDKLGFRTTAELMRYAIEHRLIH